MKWIIICYCLLAIHPFNIAQTSINSITQRPIKIKVAGEKAQKGYLMDIDQTSLIFFTNKKHLKQNLLNGCQSCQKVALADLERLTILGNKQHTGKIIGGMVALLITGIAASNPRGDGLDAAATAGIYGSAYGIPAIGLGAIIDGFVNNNAKAEINKRHKTALIRNGEVYAHVLSYFTNNSPLAEFEDLQQQQQLDLQEILQDINLNPLMHQQRFSFFSKAHPVVSGYLVGSDDTHIFLSDDLFSLIEQREEKPTTLKKVNIKTLFYYQID